MVIDFWVGGTSRCNFTFIGSKQTMPAVPSPALMMRSYQAADRRQFSTN